MLLPKTVGASRCSRRSPGGFLGRVNHHCATLRTFKVGDKIYSAFSKKCFCGAHGTLVFFQGIALSIQCSLEHIFGKHRTKILMWPFCLFHHQKAEETAMADSEGHFPSSTSPLSHAVAMWWKLD